MALEVIYGESRNRSIAISLSQALESVVDDGTIYLGYPVLATADEKVHVDALLVSRAHGLVVFQIAEGMPTLPDSWPTLIDEQDRLFRVLDSHLGRHDELRRGRHLSMDIETITVFSSSVSPPDAIDQGHYCSLAEVPDVVKTFPGLDEETANLLEGALQSVSTIKAAKRRAGVRTEGSRGSILKEIERGMANLDRWQKQAAIETPEGPQRIRGLAGSGKTVILALKAAYLHAQQPEWRIAIAFQSRALYRQFEDLVTRFSFELSNDRPDFDHLQILHAWGASNRDGVYKTIAQEMGATFRDFNYAKSKFGRSEAFAGACRELLHMAAQSDDAPIFDVVLIDEAQDLPREFFQLVYRFTSDPKRIIWAFDELQNLSESEMPATDELFGTADNGDSLLSLENVPGEARRDIILPVCYRNPPWALATAHAIGFGIYRSDGLVQHFDDLRLWPDIGYTATRGKLKPGRKVELERSESSYPPYFNELIDPDDSVVLRSFATEVEQDTWVAQQIKQNLSDEELEHEDILVVLPDAYTSKRRSWRLGRVLERQGVASHLAGVGSSVDEVFLPESVAIAHIYRAKGNEAPMVYVVDSQYAAKTPNAVSRRNTLFTAITRSRAWVRISGWGDDMAAIETEVNRVRDESFKLKFTIPTAADLETIRSIHRERSDVEIESLQRATRSLKELIDAFDRGDLDLLDLPPNLRTRLLGLLEDGINGTDE